MGGENNRCTGVFRIFRCGCIDVRRAPHCTHGCYRAAYRFAAPGRGRRRDGHFMCDIHPRTFRRFPPRSHPTAQRMPRRRRSSPPGAHDALADCVPKTGLVVGVGTDRATGNHVFDWADMGSLNLVLKNLGSRNPGAPPQAPVLR